MTDNDNTEDEKRGLDYTYVKNTKSQIVKSIEYLHDGQAFGTDSYISVGGAVREILCDRFGMKVASAVDLIKYRKFVVSLFALVDSEEMLIARANGTTALSTVSAEQENPNHEHDPRRDPFNEDNA